MTFFVFALHDGFMGNEQRVAELEKELVVQQHNISIGIRETLHCVTQFEVLWVYFCFLYWGECPSLGFIIGCFGL